MSKTAIAPPVDYNLAYRCMDHLLQGTEDGDLIKPLAPGTYRAYGCGAEPGRYYWPTKVYSDTLDLSAPVPLSEEEALHCLRNIQAFFEEKAAFIRTERQRLHAALMSDAA